MFIALVALVVLILLIFFKHMSNARKMNDFYHELHKNQLGDIVLFMEGITKRRLLYNLPESDRYFNRMYQRMLNKSSPSFTYKVALLDYQNCLKICKETEFKNGEVFFEKQIPITKNTLIGRITIPIKATRFLFFS